MKIIKLNKKHYRWILEFFVILLILFALRLWMLRDIVEGVAPNISEYTLSGIHFDLYQHKKPILVHFWASWCPVCQLEESNIENLSKKYPVITIAMQSGNDAEIKKYMREQNLSFDTINDEDGSLSQKYKIRGVPVSFIINKDNRIDFVEVGYTTELGLFARLWWAGL